MGLAAARKGKAVRARARTRVSIILLVSVVPSERRTTVWFDLGHPACLQTGFICFLSEPCSPLLPPWVATRHSRITVETWSCGRSSLRGMAYTLLDHKTGSASVRARDERGGETYDFAVNTRRQGLVVSATPLSGNHAAQRQYSPSILSQSCEREGLPVDRCSMNQLFGGFLVGMRAAPSVPARP